MQMQCDPTDATTLHYAPTELGELAPEDRPQEQPEPLNLEITAETLVGTSDLTPSGIQNLLTSLLAAVRDGNKNVSYQINSLQEGNKQLQEKVSSQINSLQEGMKTVRADIQAENNKLIKRFEAENQKLNKEFSEKLYSETKKLTLLVGKAQKETESELTAVKKHLVNINEEFEKKLGKTDAKNAEVIGQLAGTVSELQAQTGSIVTRVDLIADELRKDITQSNNEFQKRQREESERTAQELLKEISASQSHISEVNLKIREIETKLLTTNDGDCVADACSPQTEGRSALTTNHAVSNNNPTDVSNQDCNSVNCSCGAGNCVMCVREGMNAGSEHAKSVKNPIASSYLNHSDFPLPLFDDSTDVNPVYHLKQLEEFMRLRCVPKEFQLTLAYKSITGTLGKQWVETIQNSMSDYESFRAAFLKTWWSDSHQSLVKCSLYQGKYNRQSNLSLSGYFLKYATLASYLQPRISDSEFVQIITFHFPVGIQKIMLSTQLRTVNDTLHLLKRLEVLEDQDHSRKNEAQYSPPQHNRRANYPPQNQEIGRTQGQHVARNVQYYRPNYRNNYRHGQRESSRNRGYRHQESRNTGNQNLNPNAPPFQQENSRDVNQGTNAGRSAEN
jgi:hypothetical protein